MSQIWRIGTGLLASFACLLVGALALPFHALADPAEGGVDLIVRYAPGTDGSDRQTARYDAGVSYNSAMLLPRTQVVTTRPGVGQTDALRELNSDPAVTYAEIDGTYQLDVSPPNDPRFEEQWALENTGQAYFVGDDTVEGIPGVDLSILAGWDYRAFSQDSLVAVIDTGVETTHPDLSDQIWVNQAEIPGNGIDDDGNGLIDDVKGWDFIEAQPIQGDSLGHGTHVSGIIGAKGDNGVGISGVSPKASILPIRACSGSNCLWSNVADSIAYASRMGAKVANLSFGGPGISARTNYEAIKAASDTLFVISAGNDGKNNESERHFPCMIDQPKAIDFPEWEMVDYKLEELENVICVASSDLQDLKATSSNWGKTSVDLAAPGTYILSTVPASVNASRYAYMSGTSMAAPQVSGIATLARSLAPDLSPAQIKAGILAGAESLVGWEGFPTVTGGRANAARTLQMVGSEAPHPPALAAPADGTTVNLGPVQFSWNTDNANRHYELVIDGVTVASGAGLTVHEATLAAGSHTWHVIARDQLGRESKSLDRSFNLLPESRVELINLRPRKLKNALLSTLSVTRPGRVEVRATAKFRWASRLKAKNRVVAKTVVRRSASGRFSLRVPLTTAGRRLKRINPRKKVQFKVRFIPDLNGKPAALNSSFRFKAATK